MIFAKNRGRRLLWVAVYDKSLSNNVNIAKDKEEMWKERWLELSDRQCGGIPSLLFLFRFTEAITARSRAVGIFKHARGVLVGWKVTKAEEDRIVTMDDP